MLSLRHIWIISKYFCQDEKMQMLLYKISFIFTEKVKRIVTLNAIFKYSASDAHDLATKCADLLLAWKENYLKTRAHIEQSGVGSRWEFNKNILFDDVDHCARISNDIANISLVFIEFENIFKQKLQSLVYNPDDVDNMMNKVSRWKTTCDRIKSALFFFPSLFVCLSVPVVRTKCQAYKTMPNTNAPSMAKTKKKLTHTHMKKFKPVTIHEMKDKID